VFCFKKQQYFKHVVLQTVSTWQQNFTLNNRSTSADDGSIVLNLMKNFATAVRNDGVVGYHVTGFEETGDLAFLHMIGTKANL